MSILYGAIDFFGLDIGASAIRLVELKGSNIKTLTRYAYIPVRGNISKSDAPEDKQKLASLIAELVNKSNLSSRNVAVGLYSNRVFTTVFETDRLPKDELAKAINYQADTIIPTPLGDSKIDWDILGDSPTDSNKIEILLSSVNNSYIEDQLIMLESIGLNVIAFEPNSLAVTRSLVDRNEKAPQLVLDFGSISTDLVVVENGEVYLSRSIPMGTNSMIKSAVENLSINENQARDFIYKFGLKKDKLEGRLYGSVEYILESLFAEIDKSVKYYHNRYTNKAPEKIIITGGLASVPDLGAFLASRFNINVEIGNSWRNIAYDKAKEQELMSLSNQFAVAAGLAERTS